MAKLTEADKEALAALPDDAWFSPLDFYFLRPEYRCERLYSAGALERRVTGEYPEYPDMVLQYRKVRTNGK